MKGIGVSPGIAIGRAFVMKVTRRGITGIVLKSEAEIGTETVLFEKAIGLAVAEVEAIKNRSVLTDEDIAILETQIELLSDPQLKEDTTEKISADKKTANDAVIEVTAGLVELFQNMDDEYMRARAADVQDIGNRILKHLKGGTVASPQFGPGTIVIAEDIAPSDMIAMDISSVVGFATQAGSRTSHTAIIARAKGLPAVVGCGDGLSIIKDGDLIILDGASGEVHINPSENIVSEYEEKREAFVVQTEKLRALKNVASTTTDGEEIKLTANISEAGELENVFENGGEGVGLLRTEMLFMNRDTFPSEEEQFEFYQQVALRSKGKPVIVRTIDIGGDKQAPYFGLAAEQNPFLGYRAIRICLDRTDIFMVQLKAILRASVFGDLRIMLPMISNVEEVRAAKAIVAAAKKELADSGVSFKEDIQVGVMIEIPSAAVMADILAKEVDFFSIGTNDLCQYTLAVDRMNEQITHLYDPFNPGVLRLIANVIEQGHNHHIHVGMCGEMAGDPLATLLLLGMGLKEFSMSASSIPQVKNTIVQTSLAEAKQVCKKVMEMDSSKSIISYLQSLI